jgi:molybdopterin-guanine dinucleotide biosynthesis protein A
MVEWVVASLTRAGCAPVALLGGNPQTAERLALPWRPDAREGGGPLAGIAAGLEWAREQGQGGLLVVACDLPLVMPPLLEAILTAVAPHVDTVVARQSAPPGLQPLCAWYGVSALPHLLACLDRGERSVRDCLVSLEVRRVPEEAPPRDLDEQLLNVNTREQLEIAERVLAARVTDIEWEPAR